MLGFGGGSESLDAATRHRGVKWCPLHRCSELREADSRGDPPPFQTSRPVLHSPPQNRAGPPVKPNRTRLHRRCRGVCVSTSAGPCTRSRVVGRLRAPCQAHLFCSLALRTQARWATGLVQEGRVGRRIRSRPSGESRACFLRWLRWRLANWPAGDVERFASTPLRGAIYRGAPDHRN